MYCTCHIHYYMHVSHLVSDVGGVSLHEEREDHMLQEVCPQNTDHAPYLPWGSKVRVMKQMHCITYIHVLYM